MTEPAIMLVAGEASGDLHGAALCRALRERAPGARLFGMGGARMAAAGMEVVEDVTARAIVGGTEAVAGVVPLYRAYRRLRARLSGTERPHALVLIDFPEFNLRLARVARRRGVPVVYFIPPQIWAWRGWRVRAMRRRLSLVLAVFPFELPFYRRARVPVAYVGHPLVDALVAAPEVLIPIQCEYYALEGLEQLLRTVDLVKSHLNPTLTVSTILLTMYDGRTRLASQVAEEVRGHFGEIVLRSIIPRSVRVSEAPSYGQSVITYDPGSSGAQAYLEAAREMAYRNAARP